ncbi:uncharacterized protein IL334_001149 [Kwoniella shivajii]|uniref:C2H2-type domain-containing protein n=1 Tax=Kwoniella shivajii TaxID=564305 RepID=A0ABZ1CSQ0_9TREE|nr:hypothetical protein IL334_001149 [Kwoniella shivajii]
MPVSMTRQGNVLLRFDPYERTRLDRPIRPPPPPQTSKAPAPQSQSQVMALRQPHMVQTSGRYQPSRGAQRDAKYTKKEAQKGESSSQARSRANSSRGRPNQCIQTHQGILLNEPSHQCQNPNSHRVHLIDQQREQMNLMETIRREQVIAIQAARQAHAEATESSDGEEQKIKAIQLQVFVHARSTHCGWSGCPAVLNSWAILEKHIHHAHLHPNHTPPGQVKCHWLDCTAIFGTAAECEKHVQTGHMGGFSARCPFNCLFEGPTFPSLMAHIQRRHPKATPDDFVPGLIHQKPVLPPKTALPPLPSLDQPDNYHPLNPIQPFSGGIGNRNRKMVARSCFKGRYPRVEAYVDKRGAGAAIKAVVENSKRLRLAPPSSAVTVRMEGNTEDVVKEGGTISEIEPGTARTLVELVDVLGSAKFATYKAKEEINGDSAGSGSYSSSASDTSCILKSTSLGSFPSSRSQRSSISDLNSVLSTETFEDLRVHSEQGQVVQTEMKSVKRSARLRLKVERQSSGSSGFFSPYSEES